MLRWAVRPAELSCPATRSYRRVLGLMIHFLSRHALVSWVTAAMLAGCGGSQPLVGAPDAPPQASTGAAQVEHDGSWMLPEAKSQDLLYVTNYSHVLVFTYPQGKLVGDLKSFFSSVGECVDSKGDVFVTDDNPSVIYEYAHGGTKRIASFPTRKAGARGCAISPTTGDLAISGFSSYVEIYKRAQGQPVAIHDKDMWYGGFDTYDDKGNLFFLGLRSPKGRPRLSELPSGAGEFVTITPDAPVYDEGGIEWDNGYLTAASWVPFEGDNRKVAIIRFQVTGTKAHKVSDILLDKPAHIVLQYFIDGNTLVVPNLEAQGSNVLLYRYPVGGQ